MEKKPATAKPFDTVKTFRAIKEKIAAEIADMNIEQLQAYLQQRKLRPQN
jgi:hypothetical protein